MLEFRTKDTIDAWYNVEVDAIGRVGAYLYRANRNGTSNTALLDLMSRLHLTDGLKRHFYLINEISELPSFVSWRDAVRPYYPEIDILLDRR